MAAEKRVLEKGQTVCYHVDGRFAHIIPETTAKHGSVPESERLPNGWKARTLPDGRVEVTLP